MQRMRKERLPRFVCLVVAIVACPLACVVAGFIVRALIIGIVDSMTPRHAPMMDRALIVLMIGLPLFLGYWASRVLYTTMRWETIDNTDGRYCWNCGYDLTGNVSGVCPECGTGIQ